jgi:hypothetical protein
MLKEAILSLLLGLPATSSPESPEARAARLDTIAEAIADESRSVNDAAAILTIWWHESHLDERVHAGTAHPRWTSDRGRARCLGQLHESSLVRDWAQLAGTDILATRRCAAATLRVLRAHGRLEGTTIARVFYGYARGRHLASGAPPPLWAIKRAEFFERVRARLWRRQ